MCNFAIFKLSSWCVTPYLFSLDNLHTSTFPLTKSIGGHELKFDCKRQNIKETKNFHIQLKYIEFKLFTQDSFVCPSTKNTPLGPKTDIIEIFDRIISFLILSQTYFCFEGNILLNYDPPKQTIPGFKYLYNLTIVINRNHLPAGALNISIFLCFLP